jgi:hypothetical protein
MHLITMKSIILRVLVTFAAPMVARIKPFMSFLASSASNLPVDRGAPIQRARFIANQLAVAAIATGPTAAINSPVRIEIAINFTEESKAMRQRKIYTQLLATAALCALCLPGCSDSSSDKVSGPFITLRVEASTYSKTTLSVHPDRFSQIKNDDRFRLPDRCADQSEATRCSVQRFDLAQLRCQVYSSSFLSVVSAKASKTEAGVDTRPLQPGCPTRILCGFAPLTVAGEDSMVTLVGRRDTVEVETAARTEECNTLDSTVTCRSIRSGCPEDGFDCSYTLECSHAYDTVG